MRVLYVTPRFPYPPDRGDRVRSWNLLRLMAERRAVVLAAVDETAPTEAAVNAVEALGVRVAPTTVRTRRAALCRGLAAMARGRSLSEGYFHDGAFERGLRALARRERFDAVVVYSSALAPAVWDLPIARRIVDLADVDSAKWSFYADRSPPPLRWLHQLEARRVARLEAECAALAHVCLLVNERERSKLMMRAPQASAAVLPTLLHADADAAAAPASSRSSTVLFLGSLFYPPNAAAVKWFAGRVWPEVRRRAPQACWRIVGARPSRATRALQRLPGVSVAGYVADAAAELRGCGVFVAPVHAQLGVQSKLLTAMAHGCAAVVTPDAAGGIEHDDPPPFIVAAGAEAFAEAVVRLLRDQAAARALGRRAWATIERSYRPAAYRSQLDAWLGGGARREEPATRALEPAPPGESLLVGAVR